MYKKFLRCHRGSADTCTYEFTPRAYVTFLFWRVCLWVYLGDGSWSPPWRPATYLPAPLQWAGRPASLPRRTVQNCSKCRQAIRHAVFCADQAIIKIIKNIMNYGEKKGGETRLEWRRTSHVRQDTETLRIRVYTKTVRTSWIGRCSFRGRSFSTPAKTADSVYEAKR